MLYLLSGGLLAGLFLVLMLLDRVIKRQALSKPVSAVHSQQIKSPDAPLIFNCRWMLTK